MFVNLKIVMFRYCEVFFVINCDEDLEIVFVKEIFGMFKGIFGVSLCFYSKNESFSLVIGLRFLRFFDEFLK